MALSKDRKVEIVGETDELLSKSKLTVFAKYPGTPVKAMQQLRKDSKQSGTQIRVIKNRLFKRAVKNHEAFRDLDLSSIEGQLLYAFNENDEVAPAQDLAKFAKNETQIEFVGALTADGQLLWASDVKALAALPSKDQLRSQLAGTLSAPVNSFVNVMAGSLRGLVHVLNARSSSQS